MIVKKRSQFQEVWRRLKKNRLALAGLVMLLILVLLAIFANVIAPYPYDKQNYSEIMQAPSLQHLAGTDEFGRDILSRIIYGSRISLRIGFISLSAGALVGCILGAIAGYFGNMVDNVIMRICDILYGIPESYSRLPSLRLLVQG